MLLRSHSIGTPGCQDASGDRGERWHSASVEGLAVPMAVQGCGTRAAGKGQQGQRTRVSALMLELGLCSAPETARSKARRGPGLGAEGGHWMQGAWRATS